MCLEFFFPHSYYRPIPVHAVPFVPERRQRVIPGRSGGFFRTFVPSTPVSAPTYNGRVIPGGGFGGALQGRLKPFSGGSQTPFHVPVGQRGGRVPSTASSSDLSSRRVRTCLKSSIG